MISLDMATNAAREAMNALGIERPLVLLAQMDQVRGHWIFYFNDARYVETGDPSFDLIGVGPIAIAQVDGGVTYLSGAEPAEDQLE